MHVHWLELGFQYARLACSGIWGSTVAKCLDGWCDFHLGNGCSFQGAIGQPLSQVFFWCPVCLKKNRKHPKFFFSFFVIVERSPPSVRISFLFLFKDQPPFFRVVLSLSSLPPFLLGYFHSWKPFFLASKKMSEIIQKDGQCIGCILWELASSVGFSQGGSLLFFSLALVRSSSVNGSPLFGFGHWEVGFGSIPAPQFR